MINQLPPELFAQRPVRSSFETSKGASTVNKRRMILIGGIAVILLGAIFVVDQIISKEEKNIAMIPHIAATGEIKERPEQPGGIDIPHRDVAVFEQLDTKTDNQPEEKVEQLLPQAEEPVIESEAVGEELIASMEKAVTESLEAELNRAAETMPSAVTASVMDTQTETLLDAMDEPEALPVPPPVQKSVTEDAEKATQQVVTVKVDNSVSEQTLVQQQVKDAVKKAAKTMNVTAPQVSEAPKVTAPDIEKKEVKKISKKKAEKVIKKATPVKKLVTKTATPRLPSDLFTKGEKAVKKATGPLKRAQLGSFRSSDMARKAAEVMKKKYRSSLVGYNLEVVRADLGAKGVYYRVMSSRMPVAQAKALCSAAKAANSACFLVK